MGSVIDALIHLGTAKHPAYAAAEQGLTKIYEDLDRDLESLCCECQSCGDCCSFNDFDHELWLTQIELQFLISNHGLRRPIHDGICPYMNNGLCDARDGRALGCRVFFCKADQVQIEELHEVYLRRIRELASNVGLEIYYGELIDTLKKVLL